MPSKEFLEFQERMAANPVPPPPASLQELRDRIDASLGQLPLAAGTSAHEVDANGVKCILVTRDGGDDDPWLVYFHGGGFRLASALAYRAYGSNVAKHCSVKVLLVDYRLAPENPFPAGLEDCIAAYQWVLDQSVPSSRIVLGGDSAGGGLTASALLACRDRKMPLPAGGVCLSPWVDLVNDAATYEKNAATDKLFSLQSATDATALYVPEGVDVRNPLVSPVYGNWGGMPPLLIHVGSVEVLLDDAHGLAHRARTAGVRVEVEVFEGMPHVWQQSYPAFPEAVDSVDKIGRFIAEVTA
jgi:monoterpene epsilon-lactone hydrolase